MGDLRELFNEEISSSANRIDASPDVFERAIIGCLLECAPTHAAKIASRCDSEVFASPVNLYVYQILRNAAFAKTPLGKQTAAAAIQQAPGALEHFTTLDDVEHFLSVCSGACQPYDSWPEYVKQIHLAHTRRKLLAAFDDATISALKADSAEDATADAIYKVIEAAGELRRNSILKDESKLSRVADRYLEQYESGNRVLSTFPQERLNVAGGFRKGQVIVIAAQTGVGKSWFCLDTALHAARRDKRSSRIYSLEMDENDILDRMLAMDGAAELDDLICQRVESGVLEEALDELSELPISIIDKRISPGRIISDVAGMGSDRPDIIFVDHLDLFNWKEGNEVNALKGALANFKDAAKTYGVTFILVSQFRRSRSEEEDKYPHIGMLKGGSAIEQISDAIIFITKEFIRNYEGDREVYRMSMPKLRQGKPPGKFTVAFKNYRFR